MFTDTRTIISRRCGSTINVTFDEFGNIPLKIWKYLKERLGSGLGAELDAGDIAVNLCTLKMPNNEHFVNWSTDLKERPNCARRQILFEKLCIVYWQE